MWSWIYCKDLNRTEEIARKNPDAGDVWLWVAVDADSKLVPSWRLGQRDLATATDFVNDLAKRVKGRVQITTDALRTYVNVIEDAFGSEVDFAQLHKVYRSPMENETRYSPAKCIGCSTKDVSGNPDPKARFRLRLWSVRIGRFALRCGATLASRMLLAQTRESRGGYGTQLFRLQLHQNSSYTSRVASYGRWRHGSALERRGPCSPLGSLQTAEGGKSGVNDGPNNNRLLSSLP